MGEDVRQPMADLTAARIERGQMLRRASTCRHDPEATFDLRKHDSVVRAPARAIRSVTTDSCDGDGSTAGDRNSPQLAGYVEAEPLSVGREKRADGFFGSCDRFRVEPVQLPEIQLHFAMRAPAEHQQPAVG